MGCVCSKKKELEKKTCVVACKCGETKLRFPCTKPRMAVESLCVECSQTVEWCASEGGPAVPKAIAEKTRAMTCVYLDNKITVVSGGENLKFCQLRLP